MCENGASISPHTLLILRHRVIFGQRDGHLGEITIWRKQGRAVLQLPIFVEQVPSLKLRINGSLRSPIVCAGELPLLFHDLLLLTVDFDHGSEEVADEEDGNKIIVCHVFD